MKRLQLLAKLFVIPLLGLFQELEIVLELLRRRPCGAVDARQLRFLLVAAPVGAGDAEQLESLQVARRSHVRAPAEVQELARAIHAHLVALDLVRDQLELVVLASLPKLRDRFVARKGLVDERPVLVDDATHARLNRAEIRL